MNLYVGNLASDVTSEDLKQLFGEFGTIVTARIIFDHATNTPRGFGFVEYTDKNAADEAIIALDMTWFMGQIINVKQAKSASDQAKPATGGYGHQSNGRSGGGNGSNNGRNAYGAPRGDRDPNRQRTDGGNRASFRKDGNGDRPNEIRRNSNYSNNRDNIRTGK